MQIRVSEEAKEIIKAATKTSLQIPRVIFKKGGCVGGMFVLTLEGPQKEDILIEASEIKFAISKEVCNLSNDISIIAKSLLGNEIIVINNSAAKTCKCQKSFVVDKK